MCVHFNVHYPPLCLHSITHQISLTPHAESIKYLFNSLGIHEFLPNFLEVKSWAAHTICKLTHVNSEICRNLFSLFVGMDANNLNLTMVPTYMSHMPSGSSVSQFVHYAQLFRQVYCSIGINRSRNHFCLYPGTAAASPSLTTATLPTWPATASKFLPSTTCPW